MQNKTGRNFLLRSSSMEAFPPLPQLSCLWASPVCFFSSSFDLWSRRIRFGPTIESSWRTPCTHSSKVLCFENNYNASLYQLYVIFDYSGNESPNTCSDDDLVLARDSEV